MATYVIRFDIPRSSVPMYAGKDGEGWGFTDQTDNDPPLDLANEPPITLARFNDRRKAANVLRYQYGAKAIYGTVERYRREDKD